MRFFTLLILVSFYLIPISVWAAPDIKTSHADPRLLSEIDLHPSTGCISEASDNGKTLYSICSAEEHKGQASSAKLYIHDISDLHAPHLISTTDMGGLRGYWWIIRNGIGFYQGPIHVGLNIIDLRDPMHPKRAGSIESFLGFKVSDDARWLATRDEMARKKLFDLSDPYNPKDVSNNSDQYEKINSSFGKSQVAESAHIDGINGELNLVDTRGSMVLVGTSTLQLYDTSMPSKPKLLATFPSEGAHDITIIPTEQAVAMGMNSSVKIISATNATFNLPLLEERYETIASQYPKCANVRYSRECFPLEYEDFALLEDAGIEKLVSEQPDGLTKGKRILMLNDYGFWLYHWGGQSLKRLRKSAEVLKTVTELAPDRTVAWLNLGDVLYATVPLVDTETEKSDLWVKAQESFSRYKKLSGKEASAVSEMNSFNLPAIIKSSKNVCDYVAQAINNRKERLIRATTGTATEDGHTARFIVGPTGGSCASSGILPEGYDQINGFKANEELHDQFDFVETGMGDSDVMIVPFQGKSYTASHNQVVDPNSGSICNFEKTYEPVLVENASPRLCEKLLRGELKDGAQWTPLKEDEIKPEHIGITPFPIRFFEATSARFDGKQSMRIGHFNLMSTGGCGCDHNGVALIGESEMQDRKEEPNKSLIDNQFAWWACRGSPDASLIQEGDITYVHAWSGISHDKTPDSVLLQLDKGSFQPICRIEQKMAVTPVAPKADEEDKQ